MSRPGLTLIALVVAAGLTAALPTSADYLSVPDNEFIEASPADVMINPIPRTGGRFLGARSPVGGGTDVVTSRAAAGRPEQELVAIKPNKRMKWAMKNADKKRARAKKQALLKKKALQHREGEQNRGALLKKKAAQALLKGRMKPFSPIRTNVKSKALNDEQRRMIRDQQQEEQEKMLADLGNLGGHHQQRQQQQRQRRNGVVRIKGPMPRNDNDIGHTFRFSKPSTWFKK